MTVRRGLATVLLAFLLSAPGVALSQDTPSEACVALGNPTGLYRSQDGSKQTRWAFNFAGETVRPGDPFLAEHTLMARLSDLGPGPHYVLFGAVGPDCRTAIGQWRALYPPETASRRMSGSFTATLAPQLITYSIIEDDDAAPHGWVGLQTAFVDEPAPARQIVFAEALEHHGPSRQSRELAFDTGLVFSGRRSDPAEIALPEALSFQARRLEPAELDLTPGLAFHGDPEGPRAITFAETLSLSGAVFTQRPLDLAATLEFHGKPLGQQTIALVSPLQFTGKQHGPRPVNLGDRMQFSGALPVQRLVILETPLTFRHRNTTGRTLALPRLAFRGKPAVDQRNVDLAGPLIFRGTAWDTPILDMPARLVFPGDTAEARAAVITRPVDPAGAAPCGTVADAAIERADFEALIPPTPNDVTAEAVEKLRMAVTSYARRVATALDVEAICMEQRLEAFETLTALSPHDRWARNPAFNGRQFYTAYISAVRNAADFIRQVDWELTGIEQALKDTETFYLFDSLDDPEALKFGLVTDGDDSPTVREATGMKMADFELMKKHAETDAATMLNQRNRYFQRKIAQRLRYLDALIVRTREGLAHWTTIENHITRDFMPRVAAAIQQRIAELKEEHDRTQPLTARFFLPRGEFDAYFAEFTGLTQSTGIANTSFRDFMTNTVWYGDHDTWPDADSIQP